MKLAQDIFGKDLVHVTKDDLVEYFSTPREETSVLEFKSGQIKINAIFKEICAFLNTEGGMIIIGSPKERKIQRSGKFARRVCQGNLIPSGFRDKKWINGLIAANIVPYPEDIRIHQITDEEGNYFLIEVPQSQNPPHQFLNDGRYYIRLEKEAKPAPHGIVQALFYKRIKAQLEGELSIHPLENQKENFNRVHINIRNNSSFPLDQISYLIRVYNVQEVQQNGTDLSGTFRGSDGNYHARGQSDEVLVDEYSLPLVFDVINRMEPFIVSVIAWHKEAGMYKNHCLYDPMNNQFIETYKTGESEEKNVGQLYQTLQEIRNNLG